jgi:hypothetical protein
MLPGQCPAAGLRARRLCEVNSVSRSRGCYRRRWDGVGQDVDRAHLTTQKAYGLRLHGYGRADLSLIRGECMAKYSFLMHRSR